MEVKERLAVWREHVEMTYAELSRITGIPERTLKGYEKGDRNPGSEALAALAKSGINLHWLLTGQGQMRFEPTAVASGPAGISLDKTRFKAAVSAIEEGLDLIDRSLPPDKKAELILAAYGLMSESEQGRNEIVQIIRAVA